MWYHLPNCAQMPYILCWFFTSQSTSFQSCWDGSSWVKPVLSVFFKDRTQCFRWGSNPQVATPWSRVKHYTTALLKCLILSTARNTKTYSKTCVKLPLKNRQNKDLNDRLAITLMYCSRLHAWWSTQSPLATLLSSLIACPCVGVTMQNGWNNRISDGCVYAQIRRGLGMHLVTYSNHDTVLFLLIVPIKGRFVWDGIHCVYIYQRLHDFLTFLEYLGNPVRFSIYKGWNFPFLLGDILNIPLKGSI